MRHPRPRPTNHRRLAAFATFSVLAVLTTFAAGCSSSSSSHSAGSKGLEKSSIKVASLPLADDASLYIAQKKGLFAQQGLKVDIIPLIQSSKGLPALVNGQVDMVEANYVTYLEAQEQGTIKIKVVAETSTLTSNMFDVLVPAKSSIRGPADLAGKSIAVNIPNNIQSLTINAILNANNIDTSKIKYIVIPFPQMGAALQKGQVNAVHAVEPFSTDIQRKIGARVVLDGGAQPVTDLPVGGFVSNATFTQKYPKTAAAFQRAIEKAQQIGATDRKQVEQVLPSYSHIDAQTASIITLPGFPATNNPTRFQRLIDLMVKNGLLKQRIDASSVLFTPAA